MDGQQHIVACNNNLEPADYADSLEPGYRFCPSDVEIIVYYLKPQIEKETHPPCRLHKVNIYDHTPEELAVYRPCDKHWYFLTPRERRYPNGKRPNRTTKDFGRWKASQKGAAVYDPKGKQVVGRKTSLAYHLKGNIKTPWLMYEYTTNDPDLPIGSGKSRTKLTDWVICKMYKKPGSDDNKPGSDNKNQRGLVLNTKNQEEGNEEENQEPSPKRQRLSQLGSNSQQNEAEHPQFQEANNHSGTDEHTVIYSIGQLSAPMGYHDQPIHVQEFCDPSSTRISTTTVQAPHHQLFATDEYHQNVDSMSICQRLTPHSHSERPLQELITSDEVQDLIGNPTVYRTDQSMITTTNMLRYLSDASSSLMTPPTPLPIDNTRSMQSPTPTNVASDASSSITPPPPIPQPLNDGDYTMSPYQTPTTSTFNVDQYMRNWVRDNMLSFR